MPPADTSTFVHREYTSIQCQYLDTMGDMKTPQMGSPVADWPTWVYSSETITRDEMYAITRTYKGRLQEMMLDSRARVDSILERFEGYDVHDACPTNLPSSLHLRLVGDFVKCPFCMSKNKSVTPVRQGQLMCCSRWEAILRRTPAGARPVDVQAVINSRTEVDDRSRG
jgi:hypothetical protein